MGVLLYINRIKENFDKTTRQTIVQTEPSQLWQYSVGYNRQDKHLESTEDKKFCSKSHRWKGEEI